MIALITGFDVTNIKKAAIYTESSLNRDGCDHARKLLLETDRWEPRWEDMYGLGERDFNDVVLEIGVVDAGDSIVSLRPRKQELF